jgi:hypothetical protein
MSGATFLSPHCALPGAKPHYNNHNTTQWIFIATYSHGAGWENRSTVEGVNLFLGYTGQDRTCLLRNAFVFSVVFCGIGVFL